MRSKLRFAVLVPMAAIVGAATLHAAGVAGGASPGDDLVASAEPVSPDVVTTTTVDWAQVKAYADGVDAARFYELTAYFAAVQADADAQAAQAAANARAAHAAQSRTYQAPAATAHSGGGAPSNSFLSCVRQRESGGSYTAQNPSSSASGAYQYLDSSWQALGYAAKYGVPKASMATPAQQDAAAADTYARMGRSPWAGPGC